MRIWQAIILIAMLVCVGIGVVSIPDFVRGCFQWFKSGAMGLPEIGGLWGFPAAGLFVALLYQKESREGIS